MLLTINGQDQTVPDNLTVAGLITHLNLQPERVAVEVDREIVKRAEYPFHTLSDGNVLEILNFVGGG